MKKSENGITIIIIVILAVISIQVINENKILDKSKIAKETYSEAEEKEKIKLAVAQATIDSGSNAINKESLKIALTATGIKTARSITLDDIYNIIGNDSLPKSSVGYGDKYKYYTNSNGTICYQKWNEGSRSWLNETRAYYQQFTYVNNKKQIKTFGTLDDGKETKIKNEEDVIYTHDWFNSQFSEEQIKTVKEIVAKEEYWLATKSVGGSGGDYRTFNIRFIQSQKQFRNFTLFSSHKKQGTTEKGVRAIIFI